MKDKTTILQRTAYTPSTLHIREAGEGEAPSRTITGYAILFDTLSAPFWSDETSECREIIDSAAVTQELLDASDIKMTLFHNNQLLLARSNKGEGTLKYFIDEKGVGFEFDAPATADGDKALELVRRGDISGCSFAFSTRYYDPAYVEETHEVQGKRTLITERVKVITRLYDFTLTPDPAYPDTSVEARELCKALREVPETTAPQPAMTATIVGQIGEMRRRAITPIV